MYIKTQKIGDRTMVHERSRYELTLATSDEDSAYLITLVVDVRGEVLQVHDGAYVKRARSYRINERLLNVGHHQRQDCTHCPVDTVGCRAP